MYFKCCGGTAHETCWATSVQKVEGKLRSDSIRCWYCRHKPAYLQAAFEVAACSHIQLQPYAIPKEIRSLKSWLSAKELTRMSQAQKELPNKVIDYLITLILFHCDLSGNTDIFCVLPGEF
jgi:hypothetical protein